MALSRIADGLFAEKWHSFCANAAKGSFLEEDVMRIRAAE